MEVDIDVYFWMVDRGVFDDDQRNKVDMERNKVKMHREHSQRLENGFYLAKLMMILKKSVVKISRKPFSLDPNLANMKDNITSVSKQLNWQIIIKELKKFGIRVDSEKKAKIIVGRFQLICEILTNLFEFDNGGGQGRLNGDVNSEMNFGGLGRDQSSNGRNVNQNDSTNISIDGKDSSQLIGLSAIKKKELDPISPGLLGSAQKKTSKLPINLQSPNIKKVKASSGVNQSVTSLNDINDAKDLSEAETTLEFILVGLSKNLGIKPKQAAGLLSNNHKYLIHIAVKGMKGSDYSKMQAWYQNIYGYAKHITQLIDNEKDHNSMKLTLNILKCGLYSMNADTVITCARVLSKIGQEINMIGGQLTGLAWDWFTDNSGSGQSTTQNGNENDNPIARDLSPSGTVNLPQGILNESGLASCLYAMKKNRSDGMASIAPLLIHFGKNNYMEFFTYHLRRHFQGDAQQRLNFISTVHDIVMALAGSNMFYDSMIQSGVIDDMISQGIRMADFDPSGSNSPKERAAAIAFVADLWEVKSDRIEENHEVAQAILTVLKRGCRDRTRILRTIAFEQMFKLLAHFSLNRNQFAPIIYKSLTFLLIEFHQHVEIREQLMRQFATLFQQIQTIPVAILCEPLLKQIAITGPTATDFNIFDFEFFGVVANHKRATVSIGLQIVDTMVAQATTQVFYANSATSIVLELIHRFSREQPMHQHMSKVTEQLVAQLDESERWKKQNSGADQGSNTLRKGKTNKSIDPVQTEQQTVALAKKMRERLIVNFLKQIIMFGVELIKENVRTQILRAYSKLENSGKVKQPKSLHYLLQLFRGQNQEQADIPQMLQYFVQQEKNRSRKTIGAGTSNLNLSNTESPDNQNMDDFLLNTSGDQDDSYALQIPRRPLTKAQLHLEKVRRDIEKIVVNKNEAKDRKELEDELKKVKDEQLKVQAKKKVERLQLEHGVLPVASKKGNVQRGISVDNRTMGGNNQKDQRLDRDGNPIEIKIIKTKDIQDDISEINGAERQSLLPQDEARKGKQPAKNVLKQLKEFQLFDLRFEEQKDQDAVRFFVKKHLKVLKNLFSKYANTSGPINTVQQTFEELQKNNALMTVGEAVRMLKDFNISTLQASQKDIMQMFRAINKDILKKKDGNASRQQGPAALMTCIDFEGFVEFLMQLAVHLYQYDSAMTPAEYLQKLFEQFKQAGAKNNLSKLFQAANNEDGMLTSGVVDNNVIAEFNKRLAQDPSYQLPEGYYKVTEKEIENKYTIPDYFPIKTSQRIVVEVFDRFLSDILGIHILEPMSEVKEHVRARPILKQMTKDKVMSEVALAGSKNPLKTKQRTGRPEKVSQSTDASPIKSPTKALTAGPSRQGGSTVVRNSSKADKIGIQVKPIAKDPPLPEAPRLQLGTKLRLEIATQPTKKRADLLDPAYALEEILQAVEKGETTLARLQKGAGQEKKKAPNKLVEERQKKVESDLQQKETDRKKLEERKVMLKEQLDKMKEEKKKKDKEDAEKKKLKDQKIKEKQKKNHDKLKEDMDKLKIEFVAKREAKQKEAEEKKALEAPQVDPVTKAAETKANLKVRKQTVIEQLQKKAEDRKEQKAQEEEKKTKKEITEKAKAAQIKQMYQETKEKAKEMKERYREEYQTFKESVPVKGLFNSHEKNLLALMEMYSKFDVAVKEGVAITLSYNAYMNMGKKLKIYPDLVSSQDYVYIFKTMMKIKKLTEKEQGIKYETLQDVQGTKLNFNEFKEVLLKIACLGKFKLDGAAQLSQEELKLQKDILRKKQKDALQSAAASGVLKKPKDEMEEGHVNEELLNVFEKEFDVADMSERTIEAVFKHIGVKPDKVVPSQSPKPGNKGGATGRDGLNVSRVQPEGGKTLRALPVQGSQYDP